MVTISNNVEALPALKAAVAALLRNARTLAVLTLLALPFGELQAAIRTWDGGDAKNTWDGGKGKNWDCSTMFRRADYEQAGGYREAFYCAQDLDLWMRLTDRGLLAFVPEVLYEVRYDLLCVGTLHRDYQLAARQLVVEMRRARARGESEDALLRRAAQLRPKGQRRRGRHQCRLAEARGAYFIGTRLLARHNPRARQYLAMALRRRPWHARTWWAWVRAVASLHGGTRS